MKRKRGTQCELPISETGISDKSPLLRAAIAQAKTETMEPVRPLAAKVRDAVQGAAESDPYNGPECRQIGGRLRQIANRRQQRYQAGRQRTMPLPSRFLPPLH